MKESYNAKEFKHKVIFLTPKQVEENRCKAYKYLDLKLPNKS